MFDFYYDEWKRDWRTERFYFEIIDILTDDYTCNHKLAKQNVDITF